MVIKSKKPEPTIKLDSYDKKIIFYLSQNSRMKKKELAGKLNISLPRLLYKIQRLEKEVISPAPNINYPALGIHSYIILAESLPNDVREKLLETSSFWFFSQAIGKYQYVMNVITDDIENFIKHYLGDCHIEIFSIIRYIPDDYNPWHLDIEPLPMTPNRQINLDKKDYDVLSAISTKTMSPASDLSKIVGIDRKTLQKRLWNLEKSNIIQKFRYGINIFKIGFLVYIVKIDASPNTKAKILHHLRKDDFSGFIFETLNGYVMYYMPPSHKELFDFTQRIQSYDKNLKIDVIQTTDIFRIDLVPESAIKIFKKRAKV